MTKDELRLKINESLEKHKQSTSFELDKENDYTLISKLLKLEISKVSKLEKLLKKSFENLRLSFSIFIL